MVIEIIVYDLGSHTDGSPAVELDHFILAKLGCEAEVSQLDLNLLGRFTFAIDTLIKCTDYLISPDLLLIILYLSCLGNKPLLPLKLTNFLELPQVK